VKILLERIIQQSSFVYFLPSPPSYFLSPTYLTIGERGTTRCQCTIGGNSSDNSSLRTHFSTPVNTTPSRWCTFTSTPRVIIDSNRASTSLHWSATRLKDAGSQILYRRDIFSSSVLRLLISMRNPTRNQSLVTLAT
jgi:hypothetical protein